MHIILLLVFTDEIVIVSHHYVWPISLELIFAAGSTNYSLYLLSSWLSLIIIITVMKARCGHVEEKTYSDAHHGLCRVCHSNFAFLLELEIELENKIYTAL